MSDERTADRFWAKVEVDYVTGCWLWMASKRTNGYGKFWDGSKHVSAHRFSWEFERGPIPAGLEIDHLCRVRNCVNPDHLEPVNHRTNLLRGNTIAVVRASLTECVHGHPFDDANTRIRPSGGRACRTCNRLRMGEYRAKKRATRAEEAPR